METPKAIAIPINETTKIDETLMSKIKTPLIYGSFAVLFIIIFSIILYLIYPPKDSGSGTKLLPQKDVQTIFIILFITITIFAFLYMFIPNFKSLGLFLVKFRMIFLLFAYIIGLIVLYRSVPSGIINGGAFLFLPITIMIGVYLFYLAIKGESFRGGFDVNFERIKYSLLYFLLIVFIMLFYVTDPGGYISKYFGPLLIISILLIIFGFLYLVTMMTMPSIGKKNEPSQGFFKGMSKIGVFSGISFLIFLIIVGSCLASYPGGFIKNAEPDRAAIAISLIVLVSMAWILFFGILSFSKQQGDDAVTDKISSITNVMRQVFLLLSGLIISGLLIGWLVTGIEGLSSQSGITSFILNLILLTMVLGLVFKLISAGMYYRKNAMFRLIVNTILYIPCIVVSLFDKVDFDKVIDDTKNTPRSYYIVLLLVILFYIFNYFLGPQIQTNVAKQGGTILVNKPVYTTTEHIIGTYDNLNGTNEDSNNLYDYQYAISCWIFLDASSPNMSSSLEKYTSILNFGDKPNILYNARENTLMVTMRANSSGNTGEEEEDVETDIVIYKLPNVLLQKWNHIIINYSGGTVDVFYNGVLAKSTTNLVPHMSKDVLTIGTNNGVNGGICNVTYFNTTINASQIYYLYNTVKNKNPPVAGSSKESIVKDVLPNSIKNNKIFNSTIIPIKIDVTTEPSGLETSPDQPTKTDPNAHLYTDYLSFKWFATANNDQYNGL